MRRLEGHLMDRDLWTPTEVSEILAVDYKSSLALIKRLRHLRIGRRYLSSRSVVLHELCLDSSGRPLPKNGVTNVA